MPPTPQPSTPSPFTMVVCESVPTSVSKYATPSRSKTTLREVLEVDLVTDAHARGHHAELLERALGPLQERVALDVALVLDLDVLFVSSRPFRCAR